MLPGNVLLKSYCICPKCQFFAKSPNPIVPSCYFVDQKTQNVYYQIQCPETSHQQSLLVSEDLEFWKSQASFDEKSIISEDIEDLFNDKILGKIVPKFDSRGHETSHQNKTQYEKEEPLIIDFQISQEGAVLDKLLIKDSYDKINVGKDFILRLDGKMVENATKLNSIVIFILNEIHVDKMTVLDISPDQIKDMLEIDQNCLLHEYLYPSLVTYFEKGTEIGIITELSRMLDRLKEISNLQIIVNIIISLPLPDMVGLLALLRSYKGLCKFILIELERKPSQIVQQFKGETDAESLTIGMFQVLKMLEHASVNTISVDDFFPVAVGSVLEPFLKVMNVNIDVSIRPSPFCAYCTALVTSKGFLSEPVTKIYDMKKLYHILKPTVDKMSKSKKLSFFKMRKIQTALKKCQNKSIKLPNIFSYLITTNKKKRQEMEEVIKNLQFIVVHNKMDIGCLDLARRKSCKMCSLHQDGDLRACCSNGLL